MESSNFKSLTLTEFMYILSINSVNVLATGQYVTSLHLIFYIVNCHTYYYYIVNRQCQESRHSIESSKIQMHERVFQVLRSKKGAKKIL